MTTTLDATRVVTRAPAPVALPLPVRPNRRWMLRPLVVYAASRALVFLTVAIVTTFGHADPGAGPWPALGGPRIAFLRALGRWDSAWYLAIAHHGYRVETSPPGGHASDAFFPLFPMLVRGLSTPLHVSPLIVGVVLTVLAGAGAAVAVWLLARRLAGPRVADRAVALFCFFPGAFVLSMAYAEGLLVLASAVCLLALLDRRWVLAGLSAAVATATRPNAAPIVLACLVAAIVATRRERDLRSWLAPLLAPLGGIAFFTFLWVRTGSFMGWFRSERTTWRDHLDVGITAVHRVFQTITGPAPSLSPGGLNIQMVALGAILAVVGIVLMVQWRPPWPVLVFGVTTILMACASVNVGPRPRLLLAAFPVAIAAARKVHGRAFVALLGVSALTMAVLTGITISSLAATP